MKYAVVILDGAAGEPLADQGFQTSLELAQTPNLDALASAGTVGLVANVPTGMEPSSNVACTSILGYNPADYPIGRGALELSALDIQLADDEVALRANLCHLSGTGVMQSYSTDNISTADGNALGAELKLGLDDEFCRLYPGTGFRLYLVVRGHSGLMQTAMPAAHDITDQIRADYPPVGPEADFLLDYMERARALLARSEVNARRHSQGLLVANALMVFWPGRRPQGMQSFRDRYGLSAGISSGVDLLVGMAKLTGISVHSFAGVTDGPDTDYAAQGKGALEMLKEHDIVFIHIEAPDAEGHDGNAAGKRRAIEAIDAEILGRLRNWNETPLRILALPDHPTPVERKRHTAKPVPFCLSGSGIATNAAKRMTEAEAEATHLLVEPGWQLLGRLLAD